MKVAVIGCGVMGSAFARHLSQKHSVLVCDRNEDKMGYLAREIGAEVASTPAEAIEKAEMTILAIKPKDLATFARETSKSFGKGHILVSILAGTPLAVLKQSFPQPLIVRAMPNLPMTCGEGVIGFVESPDITVETKKQINDLFHGVGLLPWLSEERLESLSALAGSGPAFIFVIIEALMDGGIYLGFKQQESLNFVLKTIEGAVALLKSTNSHPAALKNQITSPGGTTIAGLKALEEGGVRAALMNTLIATFLKAKEL